MTKKTKTASPLPTDAEPVTSSSPNEQEISDAQTSTEDTTTPETAPQTTTVEEVKAQETGKNPLKSVID